MVPFDEIIQENCGLATRRIYSFYDNEADESLPSDFYIDFIAVMGKDGATCENSFEAIFDSPAVALDHPISSSDYLHPVSTASTYKPTWCNFSSSEDYIFFTDEDCLVPYSDSSVTLSFDHTTGQLAVGASDMNLLGTSLVVYMTKDVDRNTDDLYAPIELTITFVHPCLAATIDLLDSISDRKTSYEDEIRVYVTIPWDDISQAQSDNSYCGSKDLATADIATTPTTTPAPYATIGVQNSETV